MLTWIAKNTDLPVGLQVVSLVSCGTKLFLADQNNGIYKSTNKASSWVNVNNNLPESNILSLFSFGFGVYASTFENGVYRTVDDGATWAVVEGLELFYINSIVQLGSIAYVGGADYDGVGHIYSTEDGLLFEELSTGLPAYESCLSLSKFGGDIYAGISGNGIYLLSDGVWSIVLSYVPYSLASNSSYIFAFVDNGVHYRSSDGVTWTAFSISSDNPFIVRSIFHGKNLYIGGYKRVSGEDSPVVYRSNDGLTWEDVSAGLEGSPVGGITSLGDDLYCSANGTGNPSATPPVIGSAGLPPNCISQDFVFSSVLSTSMTVSWTSGLGQKRFLVVSTEPIFCKPINSTTYSVNDAFCGGTVKYNSNGSSVALTGLVASTKHYFALFEYNGLAGPSIYYPIGLLGEQSTSAVPQWMAAMNGLPPNLLGSVNFFITYMDGVFYGLVGDYNTQTTYIYTTIDFQLWVLIKTLTNTLPRVDNPSQMFTNDGANLYFIGNPFGDTKIYKSIDGGLNWTSTNCPLINGLDLDDNPALVVGTFQRIVWNGTYLFIALCGNSYELPAERVWRSSDGENWIMTTGLSSLNLSNISNFGVSGSAVYIRTNNLPEIYPPGATGAYCTDNNTWATFTADPIFDLNGNRNFDGNGTIVLEPTDVAILKSATIGGSFGSVSSDNVIFVKRIAGTHYFAGLTTGGIVESNDNGDTWGLLSTGVGADTSINQLIVNNGETAIVVCDGRVDAVYARI